MADPMSQTGQLLVNERLAKYTSWRIGGPADCLYLPANKADLIAFIQHLPHDEPLFWLGLGSNVLIRDGGLRGTVINTKNRLKTLRLTDEGKVFAEAGVPCAHIAKFCSEHGLTGAEFFAGIPGTLGGALKMNAGAFGNETWQIVECVETIDRSGKVSVRTPEEFTISYRSVNTVHNEWFLSAHLTLTLGDCVASQQKIKQLLEHRGKTQPTNQPSCGSVFKNPDGDFAARLIEQSGLKGYCLGGACVSPKHANFIINTGNATAQDVESLITYIQTTVQHQHGISLQTEVYMVGDNVPHAHSTPTALSTAAFGRVAVVMGGSAAEREISLRSGQAVYHALKEQGIQVEAVDLQDHPIDTLRNLKVDRVFNIIHGRGGEDGVLQGILEAMKLPYTGSGVLASALTMDKLKTKLCWQGAGLPTPKWYLLKTPADLAQCADTLGFPVIVKPAQEGSSIGMSKATTADELAQAFTLAKQFNCDVYAEQWVYGKEYTVALLQEEALPVIRLETPRAFYDYEAKYQATTTQYHCPSGLDEDTEKVLKQLAKKAAEVVGVTGWGRVDVFIDDQQQYQLIEINTVPGMTDHSLVPMAAAQAGIDFASLVRRILTTSLT